MAVIRQTAKGKTYYYSRHSVDGKRPQVRIPDVDPDTGRKINTDAKRKAYDGKIAEQYAKSTLTAHNNATLGELCTRWEQLMLPQVPKISTVKRYKEDLKRIRGTQDQPTGLCSIKLKALGPQHILAWLNTLSHLAYNTRRNILTLLRAILATGVEWNWLPQNPAKSRTIKLGKPDASRAKAINITDVPHFIACASTDTEGRRYQVAINSGLRMGEMMAMRKSLFTPDEGTYQVCDRMGNYDYKSFCLGAPKSEASTQTVSLMPAVVAIIKQQIAHVNAIALSTHDWPATITVDVAEMGSKQITKTPIENDFIWPNEKSYNYTYRYAGNSRQIYGQAGTLDSYDKWYKAFKRTAARAGLSSDYTFHDLRHTCASIMIYNGENILTVQRQMRHEKPSVTLDTYSHLFEQETSDAMGRMQKSLGW